MEKEKRYKEFLITIHQGASCFDYCLDILKSMNVKAYAFIIHDSDKSLDEETGTYHDTPTHKHIMFELVNATSFTSIQKHFSGAQIEIVNFKKKAYQYLLHNTEKSKEKYQYTFDKIITNNPEYVKAQIEDKIERYFVPSQYKDYIIEGIITPFKFVETFGMDAYKQYWKVYKDMVDAARSDLEMMAALDKRREEIMKELEDKLPF